MYIYARLFLVFSNARKCKDDRMETVKTNKKGIEMKIRPLKLNVNQQN